MNFNNMIKVLSDNIAMQQEAIIIRNMKKIVEFTDKDEAIALLKSGTVAIHCSFAENIEVYTITNTLTGKSVTFRIKKSIDFNKLTFNLEVY